MKPLPFLRWVPAVAALLVVAGQSGAATVPAGTHLVVQTTGTITSVDARGTRVPAVLARPVSSQGRGMIPAGSRVVGHVVTSRRLHHSKERLTVDITEIVFNGRPHRIHTTGPVFVDNLKWDTRTGAQITRAGYTVRAGRNLHFQLAQPLVF
jgi:hypothetical protein